MKRLPILRKAFLACASLVLALAAGPAFAHAKLLSETPPAIEDNASSSSADSASSSAALSVSEPVTELRLTFSEDLVAAFSKADIVDAAGAVVPATFALDATDAKILVVTLAAPLPKGTYTVNWKAVSADGHKITGTYGIAVAN